MSSWVIFFYKKNACGSAGYPGLATWGNHGKGPKQLRVRSYKKVNSAAGLQVMGGGSLAYVSHRLALCNLQNMLKTSSAGNIRASRINGRQILEKIGNCE